MRLKWESQWLSREKGRGGTLQERTHTLQVLQREGRKKMDLANQKEAVFRGRSHKPT